MAKKLGPPLVLGVFTIMALVFLTGGATDDKDPLRENFKINAIYYDAGYVEVSYVDKSDKTNSVTLEILGMETSFQKTFSDSEFILLRVRILNCGRGQDFAVVLDPSDVVLLGFSFFKICNLLVTSPSALALRRSSIFALKAIAFLALPRIAKPKTFTMDA